MQKSIIESIFPKPKRSLLPQFSDSVSRPVPLTSYKDDLQEEGHDVPARLVPSSRASGGSVDDRSRRSSDSIKRTMPNTRSYPAHLAVSTVHHGDPFLAVDRASATLQRTIQSLLDTQSQILNGRLQPASEQDLRSERSISPSHSRTSYALSSKAQAGGVTPVRQPKAKRPTLKGTRRSLAKTLQDFALLKQEEVIIADREISRRGNALAAINSLEGKKVAVQAEIRGLRERAHGNEAVILRREAGAVEQEINELEARLMELRLRHGHLIDRATEVENTIASELSSFEATLDLVEKETQSFLRRPPIDRGLTLARETFSSNGQDLYSLRSDRRNLQMARDQWQSEMQMITEHREISVKERDAFHQGFDLWKDTVQSIDEYEEYLRRAMKSHANSSTELLARMYSTTRLLHEKLLHAASQNWTPLIAAISAELEAFKEARSLLAPDEPPLILSSPPEPAETIQETTSEHQDDDNDEPHAGLLSTDSLVLSPSVPRRPSKSFTGKRNDLEGSNESLRDTLRQFSPQHAASWHQTLRTNRQLPEGGLRSSESSDDEPGPDFLISH